MKYLLVLHQSGGCDYTIECGTKAIPFDAADDDAAHIHTLDVLENRFTDIDSATVYLLKGSFVIDLNDLREKKRRARSQAEQQARDDLDRAEYARLQQKFGVKT